MPKGYRNIGGGLASSLSKLHDGGFWVSRFGKDSLELFVLKKPLFRDSTGHSVWEILDIIISDKEQGERFIGPSGYTIKKNSQFVYDIVALEKPDDRGFIANFRKVWLIDSISEKFIETSPDSFTCQLDM